MNHLTEPIKPFFFFCRSVLISNPKRLFIDRLIYAQSFLKMLRADLISHNFQDSGAQVFISPPENKVKFPGFFSESFWGRSTPGVSNWLIFTLFSCLLQKLKSYMPNYSLAGVIVVWTGNQSVTKQAKRKVLHLSCKVRFGLLFLMYFVFRKKLF